ncbi:MAG TPA: hypothetical protein V6C84_16670 [Coleofasciculaceae cyanobacterium]|jgi:hypothetical protein
MISIGRAGTPIAFGQDHQRFINFPNFDAAQGSEERSQQSNFIIKKCNKDKRSVSVLIEILILEALRG